MREALGLALPALGSFDGFSSGARKSCLGLLSAVCKVRHVVDGFPIYFLTVFCCASVQTGQSRPASPDVQAKQNSAELSGREGR